MSPLASTIFLAVIMLFGFAGFLLFGYYYIYSKSRAARGLSTTTRVMKYG